MNKTQIMARVIADMDNLQKRGLSHISLFGACAREEECVMDDIDFLVTLRPESRVDLIDLVETEEYLSNLVGHKVKLTTTPVTKKELKDEIEREAIHVF